MTEGKKGRRRKEPKPGIDLEGIGTMNFAEVRGTSMAHGSIQVMCAWRSESCVNSALPAERPGTSAGHEVWAWPGQGRAGQSDRCGFWTRATLNPRKFFFFFAGAGRQVHLTIGGDEIGLCPLSFPYHATLTSPAAEEETGRQPERGGWAGLAGWQAGFVY